MSNQKGPKIILFDLETKPNLAWCWGKYETTALQYESEIELMSFAWKVLGEKKTHVLAECDCKNNDELVRELYKVLMDGDILVAHNGDRFDIKMANTFFLKLGLTPPSPFKTIDTLTVARTYFKFNSNKLDDLGQTLGVGRKVDTGGFQLWMDCIKGDKSAWKRMKSYNAQDVELLEKIYLKLRPWMKRHPLVTVEDGKCPTCGSDKLEQKGWDVTKTRQVERLHCKSCGRWCAGQSFRTDY